MDSDLKHIPMVSVLMPVYNGEKYLHEAIDSILSQTFSDFEFLIINDGSTDSSEDIILSYNDERIRYVKNEKNIQLIATLNKGIGMARGKYIARMDADDVSLPRRLKKQVEYMEENKEIGICGSWIELFGAQNRVIKYPEKHDEIVASLLFYSPISHPSTMWRKKIIDDYGLKFNAEYVHAEDYKFWLDCLSHTKFENIPEVLLKYRIHQLQMGFIAPDTCIATTRRIKQEILSLFGGAFTEGEKQEWEHIVEGKVHQNINCNDVISLISKICDANQKKKIFNQYYLQRKLANHWKNAYLENTKPSLSELKLLFNQPITHMAGITLKQKMVILKKVLI